MKKITLFIAAMAVAFNVSAWISPSADAFLGKYDPVTNTFTENADNTQIAEFNPTCFGFAISIENTDIVNYLNANPSITMFLDAVRTDDVAGNLFPNANGSWAEPYSNFPQMKRVNNATGSYGIVFYICGFDLGTPASGFLTHVQTNACLADEDPEVRAQSTNWVGDAQSAGWAGYIYLGNKTQNMTVTTDCPDCVGDAGLSETYTAECGEPTGFYNLIGQKLSGEPATGAFIVTYPDCPAKKFNK